MYRLELREQGLKLCVMLKASSLSTEIKLHLKDV